MRIRSIKPEFWRSPDITSLDVADRLLFIGLWSYVDDEGLGADDEAQIIGDLFAADMFKDSTDTSLMVHGGLKRLSEAGLITRYRVGSRPYISVTGFKSHQVINRPKASKNPGPDHENAVVTDESVIDHSMVSAGTGNREQGTGNEGARDTAPTAREIESAFTDAYEHWPKKVERKQALEKFKTASKKRGLQRLTDDVITFGDAYTATTERQFVPSLGVWLNGERWTDELPKAPTARRAPSRLEQNVAEYQRIYGGNDGGTGSVPALDPGFS